MTSICIRALNENDADFLKYLDTQVKWGFSQKIPSIFLEFSDSAYLAENATTHQPYGIVLTYYYPPSTGWIGFLIVDKEYQKKGIGGTLLLKAVNHLLEIGCKEILLDAVPNVTSFYEKYHFKKIERSFRLKIPISILMKSIISFPQSIYTKSEHLEGIGQFDMPIFGAKRNRIFQIMLKDSKCDGAVFIQDSMVKGYGFIRYSEISFSIGPLIANNSLIALDLISKLVQIGKSHKKCNWILLGVTETSTVPLKFFYELGFEEYNYSLRMCLGPNQRRNRNSDLIYSITAPAMG
ncbi:MAG: GNAT family N-acetyltransferase [Candidatus Thorarchaeota archaeon]